MKAIRISESPISIKQQQGTHIVISKCSPNIHARSFRSTFGAILLSTTGIMTAAFALPGSAAAQADHVYTIPSGALADAINSFAEQSGVQILYDAALTQGRNSSGLQGRFGVAEGLSRLLAGSGVTFRQTGANIFTLERTPRADSGAIQLGTLRVEGASQGRSGGFGPRGGIGGDGVPAADTPYVGTSSRTHISAEQVDRRRGTSVGDVLSGIPGVLVGNNRNSGGVNINIRGMQDQGRVPVVIDGATQEHTAYRGYNGASGRSYIDPDFIGSVDIEKGPSSGADATGATGGVVRVSTIKPDDILQPGEKWGVRLKFGFNGNSAPVPRVGTQAGAQYSGSYSADSLPDISTIVDTGPERIAKRPALLQPTGETNSIIAAYRTDRFDIIAGYARRRNGNFFAGHGENGPHPILVPSRWSATRLNVERGGLSAIREGENALNTSLDNDSFLAKGTLYLGDHALELGYTKYKSAFGQVLPTQVMGTHFQSDLDTVNLDTYTIRHKWQPADNGLISLNVDAFLTDMESIINSTYFNISSGQTSPAAYPSHTKRYGITIANTSRLDSGIGTFTAEYGGSFRRETSGLPSGFAFDHAALDAAGAAIPRMGWRNEWSLFASLDWRPVSWLSVAPSLRYNEYKGHDRNPITVVDSTSASGYRFEYGAPIRHSGNGVSPIISLLVEPVDGIQIYAKHSQAYRMPSLFEALSGFSFLGTPVKPIGPEHARSWELGANLLRDDIFAKGDKLRFHAAFFDNHIDDFLTRSNVRTEVRPGVYNYTINMLNLDYAKMRGLELSGEYDAGIAYGSISWNHYLKSRFCAPDDGTLDDGELLCTTGGIRNGYSLHQVPPKDQVTAELGVRLFDRRLTVGGRMTYVGRRPVAYMDDAADEGWNFNALNGVRPTLWEPYTLFDAYASFQLSQRVRLDVAVDNVTDLYYADALSDTLLPAPGRTFRLNLTTSLGKGGATGDASAPISDDRGTWTGPYLGASLAQSWAKLNGTTTTANGDRTIASEAARLTLDDSHLIVHAGINHQLSDHIVAGIEADYGWGKLSTTDYIKLTQPADLAASGDFNEATIHYELGDLATIRARLGYILGKGTLIYGTGGLAMAHEKQERSQYRSNEAIADRPSGSLTGIWFTETDSRQRVGWTAGGGIEHAIGRNWSIKAEYRYADLGRDTFGFADARGGVTHDLKGTYWIYNRETGLSERVTFDIDGTSNIIEGRQARNKASLHQILIGINYRF